jgi:hypothetical protein
MVAEGRRLMKWSVVVEEEVDHAEEKQGARRRKRWSATEAK